MVRGIRIEALKARDGPGKDLGALEADWAVSAVVGIWIGKLTARARRS